MVRVAAASRKQKEQGGSSASASKIVAKGTLKRKSDVKDVRLSKKGIGPTISDKQLKHPSLPKIGHGVGKGLMTGKALIVQGAIHRLLTHKDHAIEMVGSIIKEMDLDPCAD